jgi:hypothetical protein
MHSCNSSSAVGRTTIGCPQWPPIWFVVRRSNRCTRRSVMKGGPTGRFGGQVQPAFPPRYAAGHVISRINSGTLLAGNDGLTTKAHVEQWGERRLALREVETTRLALLKALVEHELFRPREKKKFSPLKHWLGPVRGLIAATSRLPGNNLLESPTGELASAVPPSSASRVLIFKSARPGRSQAAEAGFEG